MKKILLLSVVALTMIMAGGDITPVEPVAETPATQAPVSGWTFNGQAVVYYQTEDNWGKGSLFEQGPADANTGTAQAAAGIQLGAVNKNLLGPIGVGFELSGISSLGLEKDVVSGLVQSATGDLTGAAITQAYLTTGLGNTSLKIGRQQLPKSLSPFAFTEGWNVFKNTFEAGLLVNSDLPSTTLVYAYVTRSNHSIKPLSNFAKINENGDMVHMVTVQNKSIEGLILTGSWYLAPDMISDGNDVSVLWGDAQFAMGNYSIGLQGGQVSPDTLENTTAFGAKVAAKFGIFDASLAYSTVDDGTVDIVNFGTGVKSPLYTQAILDQNTFRRDADTFKVALSTKALGGKFTGVYINCDLGDTSHAAVFGHQDGAGTYQEIELIYKTKITENTTLLTAYINQNDDRQDDDSQNFFRIWGKYNF